MKFIKQKGQTIVEFALILPVFCLFLFGIFYAGMFAVDYVTLNNIAYRAARQAVIDPTLESPHTYNDRGKNILMLDGWYDFGKGTQDATVEANGEKVKVKVSPIQVTITDGDDTKTATITGTLHTESFFLKQILPDTIEISSSMYYDKDTAN